MVSTSKTTTGYTEDSVSPALDPHLLSFQHITGPQGLCFHTQTNTFTTRLPPFSPQVMAPILLYSYNHIS